MDNDFDKEKLVKLDKVEVVKSLFGILPCDCDISLEQVKDERLSEKVNRKG